MTRPYRHVPTDKLQEQHDAVQEAVHSLRGRGYAILLEGRQRELRRLARELDRRKREDVKLLPVPQTITDGPFTMATQSGVKNLTTHPGMIIYIAADHE